NILTKSTTDVQLISRTGIFEVSWLGKLVTLPIGNIRSSSRCPPVVEQNHRSGLLWCLANLMHEEQAGAPASRALDESHASLAGSFRHWRASINLRSGRTWIIACPPR